jgi:phosphatidylinositol glycan class A protein
VVSTDVGGVPEVLPPHMAYLAKPNEKDILRQLGRAVRNVKSLPCETFYSQVASIYSWRQVAERTERVYDHVSAQPVPSTISRINSTLSWGCQAGIWAAFFTLIEILVLFITEMIWPVQDIDVGQSFNKD